MEHFIKIKINVFNILLALCTIDHFYEFLKQLNARYLLCYTRISLIYVVSEYGLQINIITTLSNSFIPIANYVYLKFNI